jgi:hypothetical protein
MQFVTANRLIDGLVVFRDANGHWVEDFARAAVLEKDAATAAVAASEADVDAGRIVGPYAVDLVDVDGRLEPKAQREKIRVTGPTAGSEAASLARLGRTV